MANLDADWNTLHDDYDFESPRIVNRNSAGNDVERREICILFRKPDVSQDKRRKGATGGKRKKKDTKTGCASDSKTGVRAEDDAQALVPVNNADDSSMEACLFLLCSTCLTLGRVKYRDQHTLPLRAFVDHKYHCGIAWTVCASCEKAGSKRYLQQRIHPGVFEDSAAIKAAMQIAGTEVSIITVNGYIYIAAREDVMSTMSKEDEVHRVEFPTASNNVNKPVALRGLGGDFFWSRTRADFHALQYYLQLITCACNWRYKSRSPLSASHCSTLRQHCQDHQKVPHALPPHIFVYVADRLEIGRTITQDDEVNTLKFNVPFNGPVELRGLCGGFLYDRPRTYGTVKKYLLYSTTTYSSSNEQSLIHACHRRLPWYTLI